MMCGGDDILVGTAERLLEIAKRLFELAKEVVREEVSPGDVAAGAFAEAEYLGKISEELKD